MMMVVVSYDISTESQGGTKRLRRVAKVCQDYGQRVQYSVFECIVDPAQWTKFKNDLIAEIEPEYDCLRFYFLGSNWRRKIEHIGAKEGFDQEGALIL
jgi:CRISPR-associated protein Cas2